MDKDDILYAEERKDEIIRYIQKKKKCTVDALCEYFSVSPTTIRNDLKELDTMGFITRTHGGAIYKTRTTFEPKHTENVVKNRHIKAKIALAASGYIEDGDSIALDTGTTTLEIAKLLIGKQDLTVITNDIKIAAFLEENVQIINTILIGGTIRPGFNCTVGPSAERFLKDYYVDKAFIGCNGFALKAGVTTPSPEQAEIKRTMIEIASEKIVVCDNSKLESVAFAKVCDITQADMLVTNDDADETILNSYRENGIVVVVAT